jgi:fumarylacetoacetate (FAA) hydrolase
MKLASLKSDSRDGQLCVVSRDLRYALVVTEIAPTLQYALDHWSKVEGKLAAVYHDLNAGLCDEAFPFSSDEVEAPLPRAYQWVDGSAYVNHVELVRKARGAELPPSFWEDPLMYQGGSDNFIGPRDDIEAVSESHGIDFEAEIAVITDDVPMGVTPTEALSHIKLVMLVNDVSLRHLIPGELAKGFGFLQSKPASSFSPVAVTLDELGASWEEGKLHLPIRSEVNGELIGEPNAGIDMTFDFPTLIAHAAMTRYLGAGTILGSGTVSNREKHTGSSCLVEKRMLETIESGEPQTPFLHFGDRVRIEMLDNKGHSIFGAIDQQVVPYNG